MEKKSRSRPSFRANMLFCLVTWRSYKLSMNLMGQELLFVTPFLPLLSFHPRICPLALVSFYQRISSKGFHLAFNGAFARPCLSGHHVKSKEKTSRQQRGKTPPTAVVGTWNRIVPFWTWQCSKVPISLLDGFVPASPIGFPSFLFTTNQRPSSKCAKNTEKNLPPRNFCTSRLQFTAG